jgi:AcrR family transcriptional regulator
LDQAVEVFWSKGYEATSITDLEEALGLGRQSIYNAFGGKRELFLQALDRYAERSGTLRRKAYRSGLNGIRDFLEETAEFLTTGPERRGCFLTRSLLEEGRTRDVAQRCERSASATRALVSRSLVEARAQGELGDHVDLPAAERMLTTHLYGLSAAAAAGASLEDLRSEIDLLLRSLR